MLKFTDHRSPLRWSSRVAVDPLSPTVFLENRVTAGGRATWSRMVLFASMFYGIMVLWSCLSQLDSSTTDHAPPLTINYSWLIPHTPSHLAPQTPCRLLPRHCIATPWRHRATREAWDHRISAGPRSEHATTREAQGRQPGTGPLEQRTQDARHELRIPSKTRIFLEFLVFLCEFLALGIPKTFAEHFPIISETFSKHF